MLLKQFLPSRLFWCTPPLCETIHALNNFFISSPFAIFLLIYDNYQKNYKTKLWNTLSIRDLEIPRIDYLAENLTRSNLEHYYCDLRNSDLYLSLVVSSINPLAIREYIKIRG